MKVRIYRTSDTWGYKSPMKYASKGAHHPIGWDATDNEDESLWYINIDPKKLFEFMASLGKSIILRKNEFFETDNVKYEIEIYDTYRE